MMSKLVWVSSTELLKFSSNYVCPLNSWGAVWDTSYGATKKDVKIFSGRKQVDVLPVVSLSLGSLNRGHSSSPLSLGWSAGLVREYLQFYMDRPDLSLWVGISFCCLLLAHAFDPFPGPLQISFFSLAARTSGGVWLTVVHSWSQNMEVSGQKHFQI